MPMTIKIVQIVNQVDIQDLRLRNVKIVQMDGLLLRVLPNVPSALEEIRPPMAPYAFVRRAMNGLGQARRDPVEVAQQENTNRLSVAIPACHA